MTLEYPWWATRPRCELCVHWINGEDRRRPLQVACGQQTLMMSGKIVQMRIRNNWYCDLYRRRKDLPTQRRIA